MWKVIKDNILKVRRIVYQNGIYEPFLNKELSRFEQYSQIPFNKGNSITFKYFIFYDGLLVLANLVFLSLYPITYSSSPIASLHQTLFEAKKFLSEMRYLITHCSMICSGSKFDPKWLEELNQILRISCQAFSSKCISFMLINKIRKANQTSS